MGCMKFVRSKHIGLKIRLLFSSIFLVFLLGVLINSFLNDINRDDFWTFSVLGFKFLLLYWMISPISTTVDSIKKMKLDKLGKLDESYLIITSFKVKVVEFGEEKHSLSKHDICKVRYYKKLKKIFIKTCTIQKNVLLHDEYDVDLDEIYMLLNEKFLQF